MNIIRKFLCRFAGDDDAALRERCIGYANGDIGRAIGIFRYIKDGTTVSYERDGTKTVYNTYP